MEKNIIEKLLSEYNTFTASEKKIADYVLSNQHECMSIGITDLAAECGVAVSTVSVFCRKLRLAGFNDFKLELARANTIQSHATSSAGDTTLLEGDGTAQVLSKTCLRGKEVLSVSAKMLNTQSVEQAVDLMRQAQHVLILGQGNHSTVAMMAWAQLALTGNKFQTVQDSHLQTIALATLQPGDLVIYFSYTGATLEIMDAVETIRQVGAKLVLVTHFARSPAAECADVVLISGADERPLQFGSFDALLSQMYVVDVLLSCYGMQCRERLSRNRDFIGKELSRKHL